MTALAGDGAATLSEGALAETEARGGDGADEETVLPPNGAAQQREEAEEAGTATVEEDAAGLSTEQLGRLREVLVAAHPDAVPELIAGETFEALLGSVEGARAAFTRVRDETARALTVGVPRGGGTREIDPAVFAGLSPEGKIAVGLARK